MGFLITVSSEKVLVNNRMFEVRHCTWSPDMLDQDENNDPKLYVFNESGLMVTNNKLLQEILWEYSYNKTKSLK